MYQDRDFHVLSIVCCLRSTEHLAQTSAKGEKLQKEINKLQSQATGQHDSIVNTAEQELRAEEERHQAAMTALQADIK